MAATDSSFPRRFGRYRLLDLVAAGGMAELFLGIEDTPGAGGRFVIIKRILEEHHDEPDYIELFLTEARVSLKCAHPNLPQVFELGVADGHHYLAMEYIHGHTLLELLRSAVAAKQQLSLRSVVTIGLGVTAALEHAHGLREVDGAPLGVVHRDVTPQNVMISTEGAVKLIDFGVVRSAVQHHHTQQGVLKGKLAYMAPEQLEGSGILDHRVDLFALGILMHEMLCTRPLFRGTSDGDTAERIRSAPIPDPVRLRPEVPPALGDFVLTCLERDPDARYPSAADAHEALDQIASDCRLGPSMVRLRREAIALCGLPPLPEPARGRAGTAGGARPALPGDPHLLYFLRRAASPTSTDDSTPKTGEPHE